jgi:transcription initiation factor TFIID TATA-box-binding protein
MLLKIQNVVSTSDLHQHIDARKFNQYEWGKYDIEIYGGRCGYIKDEEMQGRVAVFLSGKMISTGAKEVSFSILQLHHALKLLVTNKLAKRVELECKVQNIVATLDLQRTLDVNFPGIIYKHNCRISCLIFASGKVVIAGVKSEDQLENVADEIAKIL